MNEIFITSKIPDYGIPCLEDYVGRIELLDTPAGAQVQKLLETKDAATLKFVPYGLGEKDENGEIVKFTLTGFTVVI
jgi:hypothetical protein